MRVGGGPSDARMSATLRLQCPLCSVLGQTTPVRGADRRRYYLCGNCSLIFADAQHHLSLQQQ